jgi:hypothetical protein
LNHTTIVHWATVAGIKVVGPVIGNMVKLKQLMLFENSLRSIPVSGSLAQHDSGGSNAPTPTCAVIAVGHHLFGRQLRRIVWARVAVQVGPVLFAVHVDHVLVAVHVGHVLVATHVEHLFFA